MIYAFEEDSEIGFSAIEKHDEKASKIPGIAPGARVRGAQEDSRGEDGRLFSLEWMRRLNRGGKGLPLAA